MLGVQCMRLWYIILVQNIAPKLTERCSCTDFFHAFVQMNWRVYNSAMVAHRARLMFCEHRIHTHITRFVCFIGFPTNSGQIQFFATGIDLL